MEVRVYQDELRNALAINVLERFGPEGQKRMLRSDGSWEKVTPGEVTEPTLRLEEDGGRALLEALMRHYQGASDMHTVRADLLHERERRNKLEDAMIAIVTR